MVSFAQLQNTLKKIGYPTMGYQISENVFELINIPIIVKIEDDPRFPHFVVALNHSGDFLSIYDPSFGEYISYKSDFYKLWNKNGNGGYALIVEPKIKRVFELKLPTVNLIQK
ncbi:cysteine peptidase family C39 domain-containing protein [Campylobacter fetus]|uniref:cysteine peptidase family C39 domain-containing protein n=1 Tax=Campylobacter fetus TaxID=196 RepID=UPI002FCDE5C5